MFSSSPVFRHNKLDCGFVMWEVQFLRTHSHIRTISLTHPALTHLFVFYFLTLFYSGHKMSLSVFLLAMHNRKSERERGVG